MEIRLVGKTESGIPVIAGLYDLFQTFGIPLDVLVEYYEDKGWIVSPFELACEMYVNLVKRDSISTKVVAAYDRHPPEWRQEVKERIEFFLPKGEI